MLCLCAVWFVSSCVCVWLLPRAVWFVSSCVCVWLLPRAVWFVSRCVCVCVCVCDCCLERFGLSAVVCVCDCCLERFGLSAVVCVCVCVCDCCLERFGLSAVVCVSLLLRAVWFVSSCVCVCVCVIVASSGLVCQQLCVCVCVWLLPRAVWFVTSCITLQAPLSGTFLQTLPDLVTPLKGHSLSPRNCPPTWSVPSERFGYWCDCRSNLSPKHACKHETHSPWVKKKKFHLDSNDCGFICAGINFVGGYKWHALFYLSCL